MPFIIQLVQSCFCKFILRNFKDGTHNPALWLPIKHEPVVEAPEAKIDWDVTTDATHGKPRMARSWLQCGMLKVVSTMYVYGAYTSAHVNGVIR